MVVLVAGCGGSDYGAETLTVVAATSLKSSFTGLARGYERAHPGVKIRLSFAPSDRIASQFDRGLKAAVVATASPADMTKLREHGHVATPVAFAGNKLVVAVSNDSHARVATPRDLTKTGLKLALGDAGAPIGRYSTFAIDRLADRYGAAYRTAVDRNVVTRASSAADAITPVALGGADASISYATDVRGVVDRVAAFPLPGWAQPTISYWIAATGTPSPAALGFIDEVTSARGRAALRSEGFTGPPSESTQ